MWLSEARRRTETEETKAQVCSVSGTENTLCPANILRIPKQNETQLALCCDDGSMILLGTLDADAPPDLNAGELYIKTEHAAITVKNNGTVKIDGAVSITGSLSVNGVSV